MAPFLVAGALYLFVKAIREKDFRLTERSRALLPRWLGRTLCVLLGVCLLMLAILFQRRNYSPTFRYPR
jgi:hypothetical protein